MYRMPSLLKFATLSAFGSGGPDTGSLAANCFIFVTIDGSAGSSAVQLPGTSRFQGERYRR
jgi:hypothetical protein